MTYLPPLLGRQRAASDLDPDVRSWGDLADVPTVTLPLPILKGWIDAETGVTRFTRLLESTAETNLDAGIQRPRDYTAARPRVWFLAG